MQLRRIWIVTLSMILVFVITLNASAATQSLVTTSSDKIIACTFTWTPEIGATIPLAKAFTHNMTYTYNEGPTGNDTPFSISVFAKADEEPADYYQVVDVNVVSVAVNSTVYSSLTYDGNVLVSPTWVWDNKYAYVAGYFTATTPYQIKGTASLTLSSDCNPRSFMKTNIKYMQ